MMTTLEFVQSIVAITVAKNALHMSQEDMDLSLNRSAGYSFHTMWLLQLQTNLMHKFVRPVSQCY